MTCAEFKERAAAMALGALSPEEMAEVEAHLRTTRAHEGCVELLRAMDETAALVAVSLPPVAPSPELWRAIEGRVSGVARITDRPRRRGWARGVGSVLAAAAVILVLLLVRDRVGLQRELAAAEERAANQERQRAECVAELDKVRADDRLREEAIAMLRLPGTRAIRLAAQGDSRSSAHVLLHASDGRALLIGDGLRAPSGGDYELWVIRGERKIAAGLLRGDERGRLLTAIDPALLQGGPPDAIAVTLEPAGGGPSPRGPIVMLGTI